MKVIGPATPPILTIFVPKVGLNKTLTDYRLFHRYGDLKFGTLGQCAKNLGLTIKVENGGTIFKGPKRRMQMFVEKLHFAMVEFIQV